MESGLPKLRLMALEVTRHCRYHCPHCRANAGPIRLDGELETDQWKKIIKAIASFAKCTVIFTGGEPLERDDIYKLIRYSSSLGLRPVIATCGYLINDQTVEKLKEAGIQAVSFSIDGATSQTHDYLRQSEGSFDEILRAVEVVRKANLPFQINSTISQYNVDEVIGLAELAVKIGAQCFNPFILVPTGRGKQMAGEILDPVEYESLLNLILELKMKLPIEIRVTCAPQFGVTARQIRAEKRVGVSSGCMGGCEFGFVSFKGDVQVCGFLDLPAGNLVESKYNFAKIWRNSKLLAEIRSRPDYSGKCKSCDFINICGGCRARAYSHSGDYLNTDPICSFHPAEKK